MRTRWPGDWRITRRIRVSCSFDDADMLLESCALSPPCVFGPRPLRGGRNRPGLQALGAAQVRRRPAPGRAGTIVVRGELVERSANGQGVLSPRSSTAGAYKSPRGEPDHRVFPV